MVAIKRKLLSSVILAGGLALANISTVAATPLGTDLRGLAAFQSSLEQAQFAPGRNCERLRRACEFKGERGEVGEGNCRRYRAECGRRPSYCERLRSACYNKDVRGEVGQGNCRRYRAECRGR